MTNTLARKILPLTLAALPLLGGCSNYRGVDTVHQPVVQRADYAFDVATNGYGLAPGEPERLAGWMATLGLRYGDKVSLDDPAGTPGVKGDVEAITRRYGLFVSGYAPVTGGAIAPGTVRVVVTRLVASVPDCAGPPAKDTFNMDAHTSGNFGCASSANLAAMVANPGDLVRGQPGADTSDPASAVKAIDSFRKATPTGNGGTTVKGAATGGSGGSN